MQDCVMTSVYNCTPQKQKTLTGNIHATLCGDKAAADQGCWAAPHLASQHLFLSAVLRQALLGSWYCQSHASGFGGQVSLGHTFHCTPHPSLCLSVALSRYGSTYSSKYAVDAALSAEQLCSPLQSSSQLRNFVQLTTLVLCCSRLSQTCSG